MPPVYDRWWVASILTGTGANTLALAVMTRSTDAILCTDSAHIHRDEVGAPEKFTGCKLLSIPTPDGKIRPEQLSSFLGGKGIQHHNQPRVLSITQATEWGTVYSAEELRTLIQEAHRHGLLVHMDGARLANAAASLKTSMRAITKDTGVDVLSLGGTKNGAMAAEAVVFFRPELAPDFPYIRKQGLHLASKMRFIAAQWDALLQDELWLKNARHANEMADHLARSVAGVPQVKLTQKVQANMVLRGSPKKSSQNYRPDIRSMPRTRRKAESGGFAPGIRLKRT